MSRLSANIGGRAEDEDVLLYCALDGEGQGTGLFIVYVEKSYDPADRDDINLVGDRPVDGL